MEILKFSKKDSSDIALELGVDVDKGLSSAESQIRINKYGWNNIPEKDLKWWRILLKQFKSPFIFLLLVASALSFLLKQEIEGSMILLFIIINTLLGFFQEYRSENTVKLLKKYIKIQTRVIRDGQEKFIDSENLVKGDIVILETGDKISADLRIIESHDLSIDESILTGESVLTSKQGEIIMEENIDLFSSSNLCFSGTIVASGKAKAIVIATGADTFLGGVTKLTSQTKKVSDFEKGISKFSSFILKLVLVTLIFVFVFNAFLKEGLNILELVIFSIALAISVIPEALPLVMTFSFSKGAMNLAKKKVVVKRLSSVEDLGNIDILCSDKTGTLTENKLTVLDFYSSSSSVKEILLYANLASSRSSNNKEPFDIALLEKMDDEDKKDLSAFSFILDTPFDPQRQRNNVLVKIEDEVDFIVRGAPEALFDLCGNINDQEIENIKKWILEQGNLGRRVLAVAKKDVREIALDDLKNNLVSFEKDLDFLGVISLADPIKKSVSQAIIDAKELNVGIKIITGDSPEVAGSVAYQIGLIDDPKKVFLGKDLVGLSEEERDKILDEYQVFARVLPEQKFDIIKSLQERYSIGYLGDGINDAPALKVAGVSLAVESASDIARETADIVLLANDLNVIIEGVKEGRKIFANSSKYIKATLASNFGNFYAVAIASLLIDFLPMLPLQILLLNLLSDFPMIAIATDKVDKEELLSPKKYKINDIIIIAIILGVVSSIFDFIYFAMFYRISPEVLQTNWFISSIITELLFLFSIRTKKPIFKGNRPSFMVLFLTGLAVIITVIIPFTSFGQKFFHFTAPSVKHLIIIFGVAIVYIVCSEIVKLMYYRNKNNKLVEEK
ncbi:MAG: cation-transporting P-type ATPase [Patescibacteria group bacterium]|jgi:Mg2+-importing ATPase